MNPKVTAIKIRNIQAGVKVVINGRVLTAYDTPRAHNGRLAFTCIETGPSQRYVGQPDTLIPVVCDMLTAAILMGSGEERATEGKLMAKMLLNAQSPVRA